MDDNFMSDLLVAGGDGLIGKALVAELEMLECRVWRTSRRIDAQSEGQCLNLDLQAIPADWVAPKGVGAAYLMAGNAIVMDCENDPFGTSSVNVAGICHIIQRLMRDGIFVIYPSTSQVFDGSKPSQPASSPRNPVTEYGRQRAIVEAFLESNYPEQSAIVRFTKVESIATGLWSNWRESLLDGRHINVFRDRTVAPVKLEHAVKVLARIGVERLAGVWQVSGPLDIDYIDAARYLADALDASFDLINAMPYPGGPPGSILNPRFTSLQSTRVSKAFGFMAADPYQILDEIASCRSPPR